jgi:hypothetical protein
MSESSVLDICEFFVIAPNGFYYNKKIYPFASKFDVTNLSKVEKQILFAKRVIGAIEQLKDAAHVFNINLKQKFTSENLKNDSSVIDDKKSLKTSKNI